MTRYEFQIIRNGVPLPGHDLQVLNNCSPSIAWTGSAEIKRTLSGVNFKPDPAINWMTDELQVWQNAAGGIKVPRGRFLVPTHPRSVDSDGTTTQSLTGYDYGYRVRNLSKLEISETLPAGTVVTEAVQAQLIAAGIARMILTSSSETLLTDHVYEAGTTRYKIVQELLGEINYRDLWFDGIGNAVIEPWAPVTVDTAQHHYRSGQASVMGTEMTEEEDTFDAANVFIEIVSSADLAADMRAESINDNPQSALSIIRRGVRIADVENLDSITSQAALQVRADNRKIKSMMSARTYEFYTGLMDDLTPRGLNDGILLDRENIGLLEEQDWTMTLVAGGMIKHTAKKVFFT
jgi:uncharacterized protein YfiM (DUF2279 family)